MKKIIGILAMCTGVLVAQVFAQAQTPAPAACTDEAKAALYTDFTTFRTSDSAKAYEAGKKYLACSQQEDQYTAYLKKWVTAYEKEARKQKMLSSLYVDKKYPEALQLGKEIIADEPDNLRVIIDLGYGGYLAAVNLKNESLNADALANARKAIQMIESGKAPASWAPFKGKEDTLAYLYDVVGRLSLKDNPASALTALIKKAQFETDLKKDPWTYYFIAAAYESGPYTKLSADYKACCEGKDETPQSKLLLENINQVVDRMVDGYARAVALAGNDAKYATPKKEWMDGLSTWYKYRNNQSDAGLDGLIASVLSKPLPPEPTPLTSLPASATTPAAGSTTSTAAPTATTAAPTTTTAAGNSAKPAALSTSTTTPAKPAASPTSTTTPAKPAASPTSTTTPAKPKPRNAHATTRNNRRR